MSINSGDLADKLHDKLETVEIKFSDMKAGLKHSVVDGQSVLEAKLAAVKKHILSGRKHALEMQISLAEWVQEKRTQSKVSVDQWHQHRELTKLEKRAKKSSKYAEDAISAVMINLHYAESAVLEALIDAAILEEVLAAKESSSTETADR